jgi:hypothetical protein
VSGNRKAIPALTGSTGIPSFNNFVMNFSNFPKISRIVRNSADFYLKNLLFSSNIVDSYGSPAKARVAA